MTGSPPEVSSLSRYVAFFTRIATRRSIVGGCVGKMQRGTSLGALRIPPAACLHADAESLARVHLAPEAARPFIGGAHAVLSVSVVRVRVWGIQRVHPVVTQSAP